MKRDFLCEEAVDTFHCEHNYHIFLFGYYFSYVHKHVAALFIVCYEWYIKQVWYKHTNLFIAFFHQSFLEAATGIVPQLKHEGTPRAHPNNLQ